MTLEIMMVLELLLYGYDLYPSRRYGEGANIVHDFGTFLLWDA
jgi:hypothetical protein